MTRERGADISRGGGAETSRGRGADMIRGRGAGRGNGKLNPSEPEGQNEQLRMEGLQGGLGELMFSSQSSSQNSPRPSTSEKRARSDTGINKFKKIEVSEPR